MKRKLMHYLALTRAGIMEELQFRLGTIVTILGNIIYLIIIYFLWKAIYASSPTDVVNGMTFSDTMIYLVLASALFAAMEMYVTWYLGRGVQTGKIVLDILKPMRYEKYVFFLFSGNTIVSTVMTLIPTCFIVYFISGGGFALSYNLLFFIASIVLGIIINFYINFMVGNICFYTESIWGINIMKEVVVLLLSGATIPLAFFPEAFKNIAMKMPFQAIYNTPLVLLIENDMPYAERFYMLLIQAFWVVVLAVLSKIFFNISIKHITVNGG